MGAYEVLWMRKGTTFKRIAAAFKKHAGILPSELVKPGEAEKYRDLALEEITKAGIKHFGIRVHGANQYPAKLRDAVDPVELLYFQGVWELTEVRKAVAIVGSRKASPEGLADTRALAKELVEHEYVVVSGLAAGVDTAALTAAMAAGGQTIAVIGTPITSHYPKENEALQAKIADEHLLISQVPILRYNSQDWRANRGFFPERNKTMSALTQATIITEAAETSGTLIQAKAALAQGRKLFILDRCFNNPNISWPHEFKKLGAIQVKSMEDIKWGLDAS